MKTISINAIIRVRLTSHGVRVHNMFYRKLLLECESDTLLKLHLLKEGDSFVGELWDFMHIFGPHIFNGAHPVTETTTLEIVSETP